MLATVVPRLGFENPLAGRELRRYELGGGGRPRRGRAHRRPRDRCVAHGRLALDGTRPPARAASGEARSRPSTPSSGLSSSSALVSSVESIRADSCSSTAGPCSGTPTSWRTWIAAIRQLTRASGVRPSGPFRPTTRKRGLRFARERLLARWAARGEVGQQRLHVPAREAVELADLRTTAGSETGGPIRTKAGIWTQGSRSELALALEGIGEGDYVLALSLGSICVGPDASLRVEALVNGERAAARDVQLRRSGVAHRVACARRWPTARSTSRSRSRSPDAARARLVGRRRPAPRRPPPHDDAAPGRR